MLTLDSPRWSELQHAYGEASDIPDLLRGLDSLPDSENNAEPWFSLWSALAHQGDVYSASFAAVPYVVKALSTAPAQASFSYFQFPAWVEICRHRTNTPVPEDLLPAYKEALNKLPALVAAAASRDWDATLLACTLSAIAAAKGFPDIAEAVQELDSTASANAFLEWHASL